jgi:hypothetical protein
MVKRSRVSLIFFCSFLPALFACGPTLQPPAVSPQLLEQEAELQRELLLKTVVDRKARLQRIYTPLRIPMLICATRKSRQSLELLELIANRSRLISKPRPSVFTESAMASLSSTSCQIHPPRRPDYSRAM